MKFSGFGISTVGYEAGVEGWESENAVQCQICTLVRTSFYSCLVAVRNHTVTIRVHGLVLRAGKGPATVAVGFPVLICAMLTLEL